MKILFLGNSATYVHEIPQTLQRLSAKVGYAIEIGQLTPGGFELAQHADAGTEHGQRVLREIQQNYDIVVLQDNGNCISGDPKRTACIEACRSLAQSIAESGAKLYFYVRPPYGKDNAGDSPLAQCRKFDELFGEIAAEQHAVCVYVNRAFAYAMEHLEFDLWGSDHAHTSKHGAYLAVCVFFAALFGVTATQLEADGLPPEDARILQETADKIVLDGIVPWQL